MPCRVLVVLALLAAASPSAHAQQPPPELEKLLDEVRADRARLLAKAPPAERAAIEDAEKILAAQKGQQGWDYRNAIKLLRVHRHEAAIPVLLLELHELFGSTSWLVGHDMLLTLGVLTGEPFPARQEEKTVRQLVSEWWLPRRETITVDLARLPEERRAAIAAMLVELSARDLSSEPGRDPEAVERSLYRYANSSSASSTPRWYLEEIKDALVPHLVAAGEGPDKRWAALPILTELRRAGRLPDLALDAPPGRRLAVLITRWAVEKQLDAERVVALASDKSAPSDVVVTALVLLGHVGTPAGDAVLLEALGGGDQVLRAAALEAAGRRRTAPLVRQIAASLQAEPAGLGCLASYRALGRIKGVAAEKALVSCIDSLLQQHPGDGPEGVFKAASAGLSEAAGTPAGATRADLERAVVQWRTQNPERPLADWMRDLGSPDPPTRERAARGLARVGAEAVPPLRDALAAKDPALRASAAQVLADLGAEARGAAPALVEALAEEGTATGEIAVRALRAMGTSVLAELVAGLQQRAPVARRRVVELLVALTPDSRPGLEKALKDEDELVRRGAVQGLARCGAEARVALESGLKDESAGVRAAAVEALGALGPAALPSLRRAVRDKSLAVRAAAIEGLARCGEAGAGPMVEAALADLELRDGVAAACRRLGAVAIPALSDAAGKGKDAASRGWAVATLGSFRRVEVAPALVRVLGGDKDAAVRLEAARGIMYLGATASDEARKALRRAADRDKDETVRAAARQALQDLGEPVPKSGG